MTKNFISLNKKWVVLPIYAIGMFVLWLCRGHFSVTSQTIELVYNAFLILGFVGLVALIQTLRCPPFMKRRVQTAFKRTALHNKMGEYPALKSVYNDKDIPHCKILRIKNVGISVGEFEIRAAALEAGLNGKIKRIEYGRSNNIILLYLIPKKYITPLAISLDSKALAQEPNFLVVGKTGSGKSYALSVLLGIYATHTNASIIVCDYKQSSFAHFADTPNFYGYENVPTGIRRVYAEFAERLRLNDSERNKHICVLLIDEYGALISAQDKKTAEELKIMVANMLFMGRSLGIRVLIGVQRADADYFKAGARDQFRAILALGNLSKEQKQMLFSEYKEQMTEKCGVGEGYLLIDGHELEQVKVSKVEDFASLNNSIRKAMSR